LDHHHQKEHTMSINADPLFIAAEVAWRTENLSHGLATATPARHHGRAIRTALGRVVHPHRHARGAARAGTARVA
jgi:hypothetical protein